jgi:hypothetical protein
MKSFKLFAALSFFLTVYNAQAATTDASSAVLHVYSAYLAVNGDCSNPIPIVSNANTTSFDMVTSPTLGQGAVPAKVYNCLIIEMTDRVDFVPTTTTGNCTAGQSYTRYVCQSTQSSQNPFTGATTACTGTSQTGEDHVFLYISTWSTNQGTGTNYPFLPPTSNGDAVNGMQLANPIDATHGGGSFIFNTAGKVNGAANPCDLQAPVFSFRSL